MGRKLGETLVLALVLLFAGLLLAYFNPIRAQSDDLRIYVHMQPEKPNAEDGWSFEGEDVRVKLEIRSSKFETISQTDEIKKLKILYVWDNLDTSRMTLYENPFQPMDGKHFLFAYAVDQDGNYKTPATKFLIEFSLQKKQAASNPSTSSGQGATSQVYVSPDYVRWGSAGSPEENTGNSTSGKLGLITEEAATTMKVVTQAATPSANANASFFENVINSLKNLFSGNFNLWIMLLVVGLVLLVLARIFLKKENKK